MSAPATNQPGPEYVPPGGPAEPSRPDIAPLPNVPEPSIAPDVMPAPPDYSPGPGVGEPDVSPAVEPGPIEPGGMMI